MSGDQMVEPVASVGVAWYGDRVTAGSAECHVHRHEQIGYPAVA
jgi:hypothetical protein